MPVICPTCQISRRDRRFTRPSIQTPEPVAARPVWREEAKS
jgi:hypothetical protein